MVHNGSVPHDVSHQLVQEGGMLGRGEADLKETSEVPASEYLQQLFENNIQRDGTEIEKPVSAVL